MSPQVDFALESSAAMIAGERLVTSVLSGVSDQVGRLAEGFTANGAFVWLLTCPSKHIQSDKNTHTFDTKLELFFYPWKMAGGFSKGGNKKEMKTFPKVSITLSSFTPYLWSASFALTF